MMNTKQFQSYCARHQLSPVANQVVERVRSSPPTRRVQSSAHNVACRFSSKKMGMVIQAESHKNELPAVVGWEHDAQTYEFYDQPPKIKLNYLGGNGKPVAYLATPDFFLLQEGFTGWVECKTEEWLQARLSEGSQLYIRDSKNRWRCPAGEEYAASLGLGFKVRSSSETNWIAVRNLEFLSDYLDERCPEPELDAVSRVVGAIAGQAWLPLNVLLGSLPAEDSDTIFKMIAEDMLHVRLDGDLLSEPDKTIVFRDKQMAEAYRLHVASLAQPTNSSLQTLSIVTGQSILWDGRAWRILNIGDADVFIEDENRTITNIRRIAFEQMIKDAVITGIPASSSTSIQEAEELVRRTSPKDFEGAMFRYYCLFPEQSDNPPPVSSDRARRKWRALYKRGQELYGSGLLGLIPKTSQRGNRERRLDQEVLQVMDEVIDTLYAKAGGWSITSCWGEVSNRCKDNALIPPSEAAFRDQIKRRQQNELVVAREGEKAAYSKSEFYWRIDQSTPRHGERPFEIGHIDHTQLDLQFRGRRGEKMGKAWLTVLLDAYTRMILAWVITFDSPSYRSCMMVIRECIARHGRIPKTTVVDKGAEFQGIYFETLIARLEGHKKTRPGSKPRFGSVIERFFGISNEVFVHNLLGNNLALQKPRSMSKTHDPRELSVWTLQAFQTAFERFLKNTYEVMEHPALGLSPKEAMDVGLAQSGLRQHKIIANTRDITILCLPSTPKGTVKIDPTRGVKIGYVFYWSPAFRNPKLAGADVPVRYDPNDKSIALVWLNDHWEPCQSEFASAFKGKTEKEVTLATQEITAKNKRMGIRRAINAALIAQNLSSAGTTEEILLQRLRDDEANSKLPSAVSSLRSDTSQSDFDALEEAVWGNFSEELLGS